MPQPRQVRFVWKITALLVILQLAFAQAMAANPDLHHACDGDSGKPGHECVVTLILNGGFTVTTPDIVPETISRIPLPAPVTTARGRDPFPSHLAGGVLAQAPPRGP